MFNKNTPVDTRVAILEEKFSVYEQVMNKMELAIHKISEAYQDISKMLAIHEQRIETNNNSDSSLMQAIKDMDSKNIKEHANVIEKIEEIQKIFNEKEKEQDTKIESLIKFRWLFGGAIILTVFIFTQEQVRFSFSLPSSSPPANIKPGK